MRKFLAILLTVIAVIVVVLFVAGVVFLPKLGFPVWAGEYWVEIQANRTVVITTCNNETEELIVPDRLLGMPVTAIGDHAFQNCPGLTSVTLPNSVARIGENPFQNCPKLTAVKVGQDNDYFASIDGVLFEKHSKKLVTYPAGKPETEYSVPEGVSELGAFAFQGSSHLQRVILPDSVTRLETNPFMHCQALTDVALSPENLCLEVIDGLLIDMQHQRAVSYLFTRESGKYVLPGSLAEIGEYAFAECSLTSVVLPNGVTRIGKTAFFGSTSLTDIILPETVTEIGDLAFWGCEKLRGMDLPDGLTSIGTFAFYGCNAITELTLPDSVSDIGLSAFENLPLTKLNIGRSTYVHDYCTKEKLPYVVAEANYITSGDYQYVVLADGTAEITGYSGQQGSVSVPAVLDGIQVTRIGDSAFKGNAVITAVALPQGVTAVDDYAFNRCGRLLSVSLPEGLTSIGIYAFSDCYKLADVNLPGSLTSIGRSAFHACTALTSVQLPEGLTSMGISVFSNCVNLVSVSLPEGLVDIPGYAFNLCEKLENVALPKGLLSVGSYAFSGCKKLASLKLPDQVQVIGSGAYSFCDHLDRVILPPSVKEIGLAAFFSTKAKPFFVIRDSYAHQYCVDNKLPFVYIDANDWLNN